MADIPDPDEIAPGQGLLDEEFDNDDTALALHEVASLALRLLHEEDESHRFC